VQQRNMKNVHVAVVRGWWGMINVAVSARRRVGHSKFPRNQVDAGELVDRVTRCEDGCSAARLCDLGVLFGDGVVDHHNLKFFLRWKRGEVSRR